MRNKHLKWIMPLLDYAGLLIVVLISSRFATEPSSVVFGAGVYIILRIHHYIAACNPAAIAQAAAEYAELERRILEEDNA